MRNISKGNKQLASSISVRITDRDLKLFEALSSYRILSTAQVASLFTPSYSAAQTLLRRLHRAGLILQLFQPIGGSKAAKEAVWALARKGAAEVARARESPLPSHLTAKDERSNLFIDHTLARNDFRICFELLHREGALELLAWKQSKDELCCRSELRGPYGGRNTVTLIADGYLVVRCNNKVYYLLLESDMGTTALKRMDEKYRAYWTWWKNGGHRKRFGATNIRVLTVTTSYKRMGNLQNLAKSAPDRERNGSGLFWFSMMGYIDPNAAGEVLDRVWWTALVKQPDAQRLFK